MGRGAHIDQPAEKPFQDPSSGAPLVDMQIQFLRRQFNRDGISADINSPVPVDKDGLTQSTIVRKGPLAECCDLTLWATNRRIAPPVHRHTKRSRSWDS